MDFPGLIKTLIKPLVMHKEDIFVKEFSPDVNGYFVFEVMVHKDDIGKVIGKNGSVAKAVRTICYAAAMKDKKRIRINIDHF